MLPIFSQIPTGFLIKASRFFCFFDCERSRVFCFSIRKIKMLFSMNLFKGWNSESWITKSQTLQMLKKNAGKSLIESLWRGRWTPPVKSMVRPFWMKGCQSDLVAQGGRVGHVNIPDKRPSCNKTKDWCAQIFFFLFASILATSELRAS